MESKHLLVVMTIFIIAGASSCKKKISGDNVSFVVPSAGLNYDAKETTQTDSVTWAIQFKNQNGAISYEDNGKVRKIQMDKTGRITYTDPNDVPILYRLLAFSALPPMNTEIKRGTTWEEVWPTDKEAENANAFVTQEKIQYEVTDVNDNEVIVKTTGWTRIAPSAGLNTMLEQMKTKADSIPVKNIGYQPYAEGTVRFDIAKGYVTKAEGRRIIFGAILPSQPVAGSPFCVNYMLTTK